MTDLKRFGRLLSNFRVNAGFKTHEAAAEHAGIERARIAKHEKGTGGVPQAHTLQRYEKAYQLEPGTLSALLHEEPVSQNAPKGVPRDTLGFEALGPSLKPRSRRGLLAEAEQWEPNPSFAHLLPPRVYDVAIGYCRRLAAAGLPRDEIEDAERLLVDEGYAKLNRRRRVQLTEDEQIQTIDATWQIMQEVLSWKGVRA